MSSCSSRSVKPRLRNGREGVALHLPQLEAADHDRSRRQVDHRSRTEGRDDLAQALRVLAHARSSALAIVSRPADRASLRATFGSTSRMERPATKRRCAALKLRNLRRERHVQQPVRALLSGIGEHIAARRLLVRGFDPGIEDLVDQRRQRRADRRRSALRGARATMASRTAARVAGMVLQFLHRGIGREARIDVARRRDHDRRQAPDPAPAPPRA